MQPEPRKPPMVSQATLELVTTALRQLGPTTRHSVALHTGLSRTTVSASLHALLQSGRIRQRGPAHSDGRGRPPVLVELNPSRADLIGVEIGRGHVAVAIADAADSVIATEAQDIPVHEPITAHASAAMKLLDRIAAAAEIDCSQVRTAAVGTPGPKFRMLGYRYPDLALARYERDRSRVAAIVSSHLGCVVETDNNTRYTALGEAQLVADGRATDIIYLRVDEGVGGGVVADGSLVSGHWGSAGELGHVSIDPNGARCPCGGRGCVELTAALPALLATTKSSNYEELASAVARGEFEKPVRAAVGAVVQALAAVIPSLSSSVVVLGGRVAHLPRFCDLVADQLRDRLPSWCSAELTVHQAVADRTAGAIGAIARARTVTDREPYATSTLAHMTQI